MGRHFADNDDGGPRPRIPIPEILRYLGTAAILILQYLTHSSSC